MKIEILTNGNIADLIKRPAINFEDTFKKVKPIVESVKYNGLASALKYASLFDSFSSKQILVTREEFKNSENYLTEELKTAINISINNIEKYHAKQLRGSYRIETMPGVECFREFRAIQNVGLYIPGGTAVLPSTLMMLAVPAKLAGCARIVISTPVKNDQINPILLYTAKLLGITELVKIGGAQGIALLAYGTKEIKKVDKIFGPGNQFVTAAKSIVNIDPEGCAIDMPAGPSEVLIIADRFADPAFVAADLLSQAEHGKDSQAILVSDDYLLLEKVNVEIKLQLEKLERKDIANCALQKSLLLKVDSLKQGMEFSNRYAPEHLIINCENPESLVPQVKNAGSVFLGQYSPESAGDYSSGTNHSLPTYGYARSFSGVGVEDFQKSISFQNLTKTGLENLSDSIIALANAEGLQAHANAVKIRLGYEN